LPRSCKNCPSLSLSPSLGFLKDNIYRKVINSRSWHGYNHIAKPHTLGRCPQVSTSVLFLFPNGCRFSHRSYPPGLFLFKSSLLCTGHFPPVKGTGSHEHSVEDCLKSSMTGWRLCIWHNPTETSVILTQNHAKGCDSTAHLGDDLPHSDDLGPW
jgi:hypothetical protein